MNDITSNMVSYLFIAVFMVIFTSIGLSEYNWNNTPDTIDTIKFDYDENFKLSENGRVALHKLKKAENYCVYRAGSAGRYTNEFSDFSILMQEKHAISALKSLTQNGTKYAQAFGLVGLKLKSPDLIDKLKPAIMKSNKAISINSGCLRENMKISSMLYVEKVNHYDRLKKSLDLHYQWLKKNHYYSN